MTLASNRFWRKQIIYQVACADSIVYIVRARECFIDRLPDSWRGCLYCQTLHVCLSEYTVTDHGNNLAVNKFHACTNLVKFIFKSCNLLVINNKGF